MSKRVYIVDLIGNHSGMHYYHEAFCAVFENDPNIKISALSNYNASYSRKFFPYLYSGSTISKVIKVLYCWIKLALFLIRNRDCFIVYEFFGRRLDLAFLPLRKLTKGRFVVDIHDLYDISKEDESTNKKIKNKIRQIQNLIIHSKKVEEQLQSLNYKGSIVHVPHFHYLLKENPSAELKTIRDLLDDNKCNLLYFGHIRKSKGIEELVHLFNNSSPELLSDVHLVIAGNDPDGLTAKFQLSDKVSYSKLLRKISDNELDQLFQNVDGVLLPYTEISQSGVLEMAVRYGKPVLCSNLNFFTNYLADYQSFGTTFNLSSQESFEKAVDIVRNENYHFYQEKDVQKYQNDERFDNFKKEFNALLKV